MSELLTHGGDWAGFLSERGKLPLDFSASISPLGVPGGVRAAVRQAAGQMDRYPDPLCRALRESISEYELVPPQQILCGNGAAELIFRVVWALRPRQALVTAPTFSEYGAALQSVGCAVKTWSLPEKRDFRLEEGVLDAITPETDLVFLCEPNNPTGVTAGRPLLLRILRRCQETGTRLILDECFGDLLDDPESHTLKGSTPWRASAWDMPCVPTGRCWRGCILRDSPGRCLFRPRRRARRPSGRRLIGSGSVLW